MDKNRIPTIKQGKEFMNKVRELEKKDIEKCSNLMLLLAEAVCKNKKIDYSVNVEEGNNFVNSLKQNITGLGGFCAKYNLHGKELAATTDGCGTKLDLANRLNILDTIGIDLVAMNINDLLAKVRKENNKEKKENYIFLGLIFGVVAVTGIIASL